MSVVSHVPRGKGHRPMSFEDASTVRQETRKRVTDKHIADLIGQAIDLGARVKFTRNGALFHGPSGRAGIHWTTSDWRTARNFAAELRRAGIPIPYTTTGKGGAGKQRAAAKGRPAPARLKAIPAPYEAPRVETITYRLEPEPEPAAPVVTRGAAGLERIKRAPVVESTARTIPPWYAPTYVRLPERLRCLDPHVAVEAMRVADGDPRRITVDDQGAAVVWNHPRT